MTSGYVWEPIKGRVRPFREWRQIQRGRNAGRVEITLPSGSPKRVIVDPDNVRRWPKRGEE